jgi:cell division protein ZipA
MGLMDLTIRDWMVIVGVLLILAVLLDAWRRIRSDNYSRVKMDLVDPEDIPPEPENEYQYLRELPNGGARVVQREDVLSATSAEHGSSDAAVEGDGVSADNLDWLEGMSSTGDIVDGPGLGKLHTSEEPEVIMLNVVARSPAGFKGEDILHILLACDLRFGDMSFFHRHEQEKGRGAIQFSVANMMQPGIFDIDNMAKMNTPGLVFFLTLPGPDDMMQAFEYMLETAQAVARNLGGDVLDESRSALTRQSLDHARGRITELERRLLAQAR